MRDELHQQRLETIDEALTAIRGAPLGSDEALMAISVALLAVTSAGDRHLQKRFYSRRSGPQFAREQAINLLRWLAKGVRGQGPLLRHIASALDELGRGQVLRIAEPYKSKDNTRTPLAVRQWQRLAGLAFATWLTKVDGQYLNTDEEVKVRFGLARGTLQAWALNARDDPECESFRGNIERQSFFMDIEAIEAEAKQCIENAKAAAGG